MIGLQHIEVEGKRFVLLPENEYERLCSEAGEALASNDQDLPALPKPDKHGRVPALEYARISLARDLIRDRKGVGLSQQKLAEMAGIRQETLSRIETGKHTATAKTVDKIMRVIESRRKGKGRKSRSNSR
ncbi:MAG: helix-turn-helix transcriptional regulator [Thermoguttaceae bacterium]